MLAELLTLEALFTLFMLVLLQAVLGFDNLLYIAIESNKVGDPEAAKKVRKWGIGLAVVLLVTLLGGAFIIYTAIKEIHHLLAVDHIEHSEGSGRRSVMGAIALIVAMNLVFSVDSILSAMAIASVDAANIINAAGDTLSTFQGTIVDCKAALIADPVLGAVGCEPTKTYQVPLMVGLNLVATATFVSKED